LLSFFFFGWPAESSEEEEEEEEETYEYSRSSNQDKNSHLAVSYNTDRSFVVRGNQIGVFKNTSDSLEFSTSIKDVKTPKGKSFAPTKVCSPFSPHLPPFFFLLL
jgi:hypothetical protein